MSPENKKQFIEQELYHELCGLLEAAAFWRILKDSGGGCEVSIAMESALIHARNLFIFFASTKGDKENKNSAKMTDFGLKMYETRVYSDAKEAMNRHLFHLNINRMRKPTNLKNSGHINEKVQTFADEVLRLWKMFEKENGLDNLKSVAQDARLRAEQDALNTAESRVASILYAAQAQENQPVVS